MIQVGTIQGWYKSKKFILFIINPKENIFMVAKIKCFENNLSENQIIKNLRMKFCFEEFVCVEFIIMLYIQELL